MTNKRKNIDDDVDENNYDYADNFIVRDDIPVKKNNPIIDALRKQMGDREVTEDKLIQCGLNNEDMIWFLEHLDILNNLEPYTEDRYKMKTKIFNKFKEIKSNNDNREITNKLREIANISDDLSGKIINSKHPDYIKSIMYKKYIRVNETDRNKDEDYFKAIEWIETVLDLPTSIVAISEKNIGSQIKNLMNSLDNKLYGLNHVKEKIIEAYCAMGTNNKYKKNIIALVGAPGVGKTALAASIAEAMGLPFEHVSIGCIKDVNTLVGHSATYVSSRPGIFVELLRKMKALNGVILLDEVDKISYCSESGSITAMLLHILDRTQNDKFRDMYMPEITIDLSNIFFILAMNDENLIDPILKDRLCIVKIDGYNQIDKIKIGMDFIMPKIMCDLRFQKADIIISKDIMKYILTKSCDSDVGVRKLEKSIRKIFERLNVLKHIKHSRKKMKMSYHINGLKFPLIVTEKHIDLLLE